MSVGKPRRKPRQEWRSCDIESEVASTLKSFDKPVKITNIASMMSHGHTPMTILKYLRVLQNKKLVVAL